MRLLINNNMEVTEVVRRLISTTGQRNSKIFVDPIYYAAALLLDKKHCF